MLNRHEKYFSITLIFMLIFIIISVILFSLRITLLVNYPKIKKYEEISPRDIDIYCLKYINFEKSNDMIEYKRAIIRLGETGYLDFDCYSGTCIREKYIDDEDDDDDDDYDDDDDDYFYSWKSNLLFFVKNNLSNYNFFSSKQRNIIDKNVTNDKKIFSYIYTKEIDYQCSSDCAINKAEKCTSCPKQYYSREGTCDYRTKISYNSNKFCYSNNIIFKWRGYLYTRKMLTYSFIKDAFLPSEDCPDDRKLWGILDNYGHKLCLPFNEIYPINKIAVNNIPNDGYKYTSIEIDNITLYYTNEAVKNGRILRNVNVDSTVKIVNDCEILDTIPLLDLMEYNRNIYFDLKDKITSEDKAFLKWCPALKDGITDLVKRRE